MSASLKARTELDERTVPLAGLVAAFIFAVQMVNFPILPGVSGHLLGGALAAILVGPFTGALCVSIVLVVQALLFADGGVTALGTNITNMAVIGVAAGYSTAVVLYRVVRRGRDDVLRTGRGGGRLPLGRHRNGLRLDGLRRSSTHSAERQPTSLGTVAAYMLGTHVLIGIGEGIITALTVMAVVRARPDLVYLLRATPQGSGSGGMTATTQRRWRFWVGFAVVTLLIAGGVSFFASSSPDGLDSATLQGCQVVETADGEQAARRVHRAARRAPCAGRLPAGRLRGRRARTEPVGIAGIIGVLVTVRRRRCCLLVDRTNSDETEL